MNPEITEKDVFLYHAGLLPRDRRRAVEEAYETDARVREWYDDLAPAEDEPARVPEFGLADPKAARLAAVAFDVVAREEGFEMWMDWVLEPSPALPQVELATNRPLVSTHGMVYRDEVPADLTFDSSTIEIPEVTCPCIEPDYRRGYLTVRQPLGALPDGRIDIVAVRLRAGGEPATYRTSGWPLERGKKYWHDKIPLATVLKDGWVGEDQLVYVVQAAAPAVRQGGGQ